MPEKGYVVAGWVRRGYPRIRRTVGTPASAPKATRPDPGRPKGRTSTPAPRHPVGKKLRKVDVPRRRGAEEELSRVPTGEG